MKSFTPLYAVALTLTVATAPSAAKADERAGQKYRCDVERVEAQFVDNARGLGVLCASSRGLSGSARVYGLVPGDAYTVWWIYFDDPKSCVGNPDDAPPELDQLDPCGVSDFAGVDPIGVFGRMDAGIAPRSGVLTFNGRVRGLTPTRGAEIWMWVFGHGPANTKDGRQLARQLLTPEDPSAGAPHLGIDLPDSPRGFPAAVIRFDAG